MGVWCFVVSVPVLKTVLIYPDIVGWNQPSDSAHQGEHGLTKVM